MPPRRSARLAELANPHFQLPFPPNVVTLLFSLLPLDARLRARGVCRGWRFFLEDVRFWTHVDLSASCGVNSRFFAWGYLALQLLRAACLRAKGSLRSVDFSGDVGNIVGQPFVLQWLEYMSAADKGGLHDLVAQSSVRYDVEQVTALCRALPLCRVRCGVSCSYVEALPLLRRKPPFTLLSMNTLAVVDHDEDGDRTVLDLASALTGYTGIESLHLFELLLTTRAVVDALVDAAISADVKSACFHDCGLSQTALPALTRLLQSPGFERLSVWNGHQAMFEGPAMPVFCDALRNCASLMTLELLHVNLWDDTAAASQLFAVMEGHPALQELSTEGNRTNGMPAAQQAAGECLARLIARSTSLRVLHLSYSRLGEAGMAPMFQALTGDSGLAELDVSGEQISTVFARTVVLPAVRASTRLRKLEGVSSVSGEPDPSLREVDDILEARRQAD